MATVYLSLGSNQGDRHAMLRQAVQLLGEVGEVQAVSSFIETEPWGYESAHRYVNAAVRLVTTLSPTYLLDATQEIERRLGRTQKTGADGIYHDRPIDIDILTYDAVVMHTPRLTLPHPRMAERDFVMTPLREVMANDEATHC